MKKILVLLSVAIFLLAGCAQTSQSSDGSDNGSSINSAKTTDSKEVTLQDGSKIKIIINKVSSTEERNAADTSDPNEVIALDYGYQNISSDQDIEINENMFRVYDGNNALGTLYNLTSDKKYGYIKKGTTLSNAILYYALLNNSDTVTIDFRYAGGSSGTPDASFSIEVQDQ